MKLLCYLGLILLIPLALSENQSQVSRCDPKFCTVGTPCIKTTSGCVRGTSRTVQLADGRDGKVRFFLGVPFAKPPVGNLRFMAPEPIQPWGSKVVNALHYGPSCYGSVDLTYPGFKGSEMWNPPGGRANMSEDCLYLNIWMPEHRNTEKLPVMVWIFGGGYFSGSAALDIYRGQFLALAQNVIVMSMSYRIGSLGFLSTGDSRIKGNAGLADQRLAIKWLHDNLEVLGGDVSTVTLMGESAGAASVGYHIVNKQTSQYFKRAAMHSATQLAPWAYTRPNNVIVRAQRLLEILNCPNDNRTLQCLQGIEAGDFVDKDWVISNTMFFSWTPVRDGDFVIADPLIDLQTSKLERKEILFSSNKDEGTFWIVYNFYNQFSKDTETAAIDQKQLKADFDVLTADLPDGNEKRVLYQEYSNWSENSNSSRNAKLLDLILGDRHFTCPAEYFAELYTGVRKYYLQYYYRDSLESWPDWFGVIHGADCQWYFGIPLDKELNYLTYETKFANQILQYYGNFVRTGNPNGKSLVRWPEYTPASKPLLRFTPSGKFQVKKFDDEFYARSRACAKWNQIERISTCCSLLSG